MKTAVLLSAIVGANAAPQLMGGSGGGSLLSGLMGGGSGGSLFSGLSGLLGGGSSGGGSLVSGLLSGLQGLVPAGVDASSENVSKAFGDILAQGQVPFGPAPEGCAKYEVMVARGTLEPGPFGVIVGDPLIAQVKKDMAGEDVRGYAVQYPAMIDSATGIRDVVNRVTKKAQECPDMTFSLVGYSQGGMVVSSAASQIPEDLFKQKVKSVVLYGAGTGDGGGMGMMMGRGGGSSKGYIKDITMANCAPGDMCGNSDPRGVIGHLTYGQEGTQWHARASQYIKDAFLGKPEGYKLMKSPTK